MNEFPMVQYIDQEGKWVSDEEKLSREQLRMFYYHMLRIRTFDKKAVTLQRQGRLGTYALFEGQEAAQVGSALALESNDWVFPTYRDHGATLTFGADMAKTFLYWNGRLEGCVPPEGKRIFPPAVPIATQIPHAVGVGMTEKRKGTGAISIAYFGDGATSEGDFHEGLNFGSVFKTPTIFFCQNNGFAISVPFEKQMNSETIAQKSVAYGIPGIRIDGNDCVAVYQTVKKAAERARAGEGPTLIEAMTWRYGAHTTADDPTKYRDQTISDERRKTTDPVTRLALYMKNEGLWDDDWAQSLEEEITAEVNEAVEKMEAFSKPDVNDLFDHVFATPVWPIEEQKTKYLNHLKGVNA
ncbi:pyruvate dehydrogenase (acetyl-transferring) E1 component subunit alpha [Alkalihalobacillus sp. LMS6]|uniref:pyruvate dehydrogenase (acetyl-transferring) E1 component subunit alpha n=1 Tax=Bacillaceae TaxID=186817 RepID=UPI000C069985|nr:MULTISPECIES: pyruvate dehydrogenase (acetyl-transferring) E1 component subunit alpha [Bacillaceae]UTR07300.1 pyruvate dehydrogenase (acetyl-transferring) E1 component subunit alpha [Alkalihalobacillus sp. LMS6]